MYQGVCAFSGLNIPKGSGIHRVGNDSKVTFVWGKKEHNYIKEKVTPRSVKWTEASRAFYNKTHVDKAEKTEFVPITKIVRGFTLIPKALIANTVEAPKKTEGPTRTYGKRDNKAYKNASHRTSNFRN